MRNIKYELKPQDIIILLKILAKKENPWFHHTLADELGISQSEVSQSLERSSYAGLIDNNKKRVNRLALKELLFGGLSYIFPQQPGAMVRGMATAHSALPLKDLIQSNENYVWPHAKGNIKGYAINPLYPSVVEASMKDSQLYEMLALVDSLRIGRAREKELAKKELEKIIDYVR